MALFADILARYVVLYGVHMLGGRRHALHTAAVYELNNVLTFLSRQHEQNKTVYIACTLCISSASAMARSWRTRRKCEMKEINLNVNQ